jgi:hypothetical protein
VSDLVIREADGWHEISDLVNELDAGLQKELWEYVAQGRQSDAHDLLDLELGDGLQEKFGKQPFGSIKVLSVPDDRQGESIRVWVMVRK